MLAAQLSQEMPPLILDVRSPEEYAAGHIPGAINIEYSQLSEQIETLRSYEAEEIVIYCERGFRANRAIATLETAEKIARETAKGEAEEDEFSTTVLFLEGHMRAWRRANLPIEKSSL
ncbi:MAG: rhodanese-like domain-containing protein [Cyanobacteria bacterium J06627_28]